MEEEMEKYKRAGKIAGEVLKYAATLVEKNARVVDVAEKIDEKILSLGVNPGFPVNISINEMAAHFTPQLNETLMIKEEDYVKLDVGISVDGYIGDTAMTVRVAGKDDLIECSEKMLAAALEMFKPGTTIGEIGEAIESVSKEFGFNAVRNLTGHSLDRYDLHAGRTIPNIKNDSKYQLREDEIYAVEPFVTTGEGFVKESGSPLIFRWINDVPSRYPEARRILELAKNKYQRLPFAKRWIQKEISPTKVELALRQLIAEKALYGYTPLKEVSEKPVSQAEHTVIVKDKPIITTLRK